MVHRATPLSLATTFQLLTMAKCNTPLDKLLCSEITPKEQTVTSDKVKEMIVF